MEIVQRIVHEKAEYHGEFVNFDPMIARPKPVRKPHPPIHVGGAFSHGARRVIRYGDGWIPGGDIREVLPKFREMAREAGRDPAGIEITSFATGEDLDRVKRLNEMGESAANSISNPLPSSRESCEPSVPQLQRPSVEHLAEGRGTCDPPLPPFATRTARHRRGQAA
jgi:alkanesulfonate monooxygenase SsuD/methylene tetrahydromethanopterin reductase-like flavin-dependent oxidoreductase (luciferase family)